MLWGGSDLDTTNVPAWNTTYKGDVVFDEKFAQNFHLPENQVYMRDTCNTLKGVKGITKQEE
jgi:hypothetical protein